jgi:predicted TIM-barrel fold metal-dependent hydrolase
MTVFDCHCHLWSRPAPQRAYPWTPDPHLLGDLLEVFDEHGVDGGIQVTPLMAGFDNGYGVRSAQASGDRIAVFGRFDPLAPEVARRLTDWMATPGAAGVRLTFFGDDQQPLEESHVALEGFWAAAAAQAVPVAVFAPRALPALLGVLERHQQLRLIVDHLGLGVYEGCPDPLGGFALLERFADHPQVLVKVSGAVECSAVGFPFADVHELLLRARDWFGADRMLWGSNYPVVTRWASYRESLEYLRYVDGLTAEEHDAIVGRATLAVLGRG